MSTDDENDVPSIGSTGKLHQKLHASPADELDAQSLELLQQKIEETEEKANDYWERLLRAQAEAKNTLQRVERDIANAHKYALEKFVLELLPIVDSLERCVQVETENSSILEGVKLTLQMFCTTLEKFGVQQVDPEAQTFNPELHQAVSVKEDKDAAPNTVLNVFQKGYLLNNRLIRPAMVVVSKA